MSAKHTPGPWTQGKSEIGADCVWLNGATEPKDEMGPSHTWIDCGTRANACLIAAAPDLLDALQAFPGFTDDATAGDAWLEKMRAAIAKAIG